MTIIRFAESASATEEEFTQFCKERMAKFKVPQFYIFQEEEFPKTSIGKLRKNIIRADVLKKWDPSK